MQPGYMYYVCGLGGKAFSFDGVSTWTALNTGVANHLFCIWGASWRDVWFGGGPGILLRYDGSTFTPYISPVPAESVIGMVGSSANDIYATTDANPGKLLHFDGAIWSHIDTANSRLGSAMHMYGGSVYMGRWGAGPGLVVYNGGFTYDTALPAVGNKEVGGVAHNGTNWYVSIGGTGPIGLGGDYTFSGYLDNWAVSDVAITANQRGDYAYVSNHLWGDPTTEEVYLTFYNSGGGIPNISGIRKFSSGVGWATDHVYVGGANNFAIFGVDRNSILAVGGAGWYIYNDGTGWTETQQPDVIVDQRGVWGTGLPLEETSCSATDTATVVLGGPVRASGSVDGDLTSPTMDPYKPG